MGQKGLEAYTVIPIPKINCEAVGIIAGAAPIQLPTPTTAYSPGRLKPSWERGMSVFRTTRSSCSF